MLLAENTMSATAKATADDPVQVAVDYSRALRAIGQDLTDLFPKILEIENDGASFVARGQSHPDPFRQSKKLTRKNVWHTLIGKKVAPEPIANEPSAASFQRTYAPAEIDRLDRLYSANRTGRLERPDSYSLPERLRAMGDIVNSRNGRLKRLCKTADNLFVEYWDQHGEIQTAKLTTVIMYRNPQDQLPCSATPKELWEGYDF
jgi:hypothetical protein